MGYIYKITNKVNGKKYIGKTEYANPTKRFKEHINDSKKDCEKHRPLYRAFNKYGIDNFDFEIIEETDNTSSRERYWIEYYNTYYGEGYNATLGGDGKKYLNISDKEVIDMYYKLDNNMSDVARYYNVDICTVKNILLKNKIKLNSSIENVRKKQGIKIHQIEPYTYEIINTFECISDANKYFGKDGKNGNIRTALKNNNKSAYGYKWVYA